MSAAGSKFLCAPKTGIGTFCRARHPIGGKPDAAQLAPGTGPHLDLDGIGGHRLGPWQQWTGFDSGWLQEGANAHFINESESGSAAPALQLARAMQRYTSHS